MNEFLLEHWTKLVALAGLLAASGFFSSCETAAFALTGEEIAELRRRHPRSGRIFGRLSADPQGLLATVLFGNMLVNILFFCVAALLAWEFGRERGSAAILAAGVAPPLLLIAAGEILPKSIAVAYPKRIARLTLPLLWVFYHAIHPVRVVLARLTAPAAGQPPARRVTAEELRMLVELSRASGALSPGEEEMLSGILRLGEMRVREIMTPRVDVVRTEVGRTPPELLALAKEATKTNILVYERHMDNIVGYVSVREVLAQRATGSDLRPYLRQVVFIPELACVETALARFIGERLDLAVAVDEYGGTEGLVTLEDMLEAVVGEIEDEFAEPDGEEEVRRLPDGRYSLDGRLAAHDWAEILDVEFEPGRTPPATLGGFVVSLLGHCPREGDEVAYRNIRFHVERVTRRRIARVLVELLEEAESAPPA